MSVNTTQHARKKFLVFAVTSAVLMAAAMTLPGHSVAKEALKLGTNITVTSSGFADLIEKVEPSVVTIEVDKRAQAQLSDYNSDPQAGEFMQRFFGPQRMNPSQREPIKGAGSGFVVDEAGYIVTNNHVIANAETVSVRLSDDRQFTAEVIGTDEKTDLALLKIDADDLPATSFGDSDGTRVGDWVVAIGNPFGLGGTATVGIVSARGRDIRSGPYDDYLQIDAPINKGNSGGPIFNTRGKVVGVNTAIYSPNGGSVGIGFAIPANQVQNIVAELKNNGTVNRGWLGVLLQDINEELAEGLNLESQKGVLIADVVEDSPAEHAGIEVGDVILGYDGKEIVNARALSRIVGASDSNDKVTLDIHRGEEQIELQVTLGAADTQAALAGAEQKMSNLGLALSPLTDELRDQLGVDAGTSGAVIVNIDPQGTAAKRGLQRGDILVRADRKPVNNPNDLKKALQQAQKQGRPSVSVLVRRGDTQQFSTLPVA